MEFIGNNPALLKGVVDHLTTELTAARDADKKAQAEISQLKSRIEELERQNLTLEKEFRPPRSVPQDQQQLQTRINELQKENRVKEMSMRTLEKSFKAEHRRLSERKKSLEIEVDKFNRVAAVSRWPTSKLDPQKILAPLPLPEDCPSLLTIISRMIDSNSSQIGLVSAHVSIVILDFSLCCHDNTDSAHLIHISGPLHTGFEALSQEPQTFTVEERVHVFLKITGTFSDTLSYAGLYKAVSQYDVDYNCLPLMIRSRLPRKLLLKSSHALDGLIEQKFKNGQLLPRAVVLQCIGFDKNVYGMFTGRMPFIEEADSASALPEASRKRRRSDGSSSNEHNAKKTKA